MLRSPSADADTSGERMTVPDSSDSAGVDYRTSGAGRRQSWFGMKRHVKRFMSLPVPHAALRVIVRLMPSLRSGRLPAPARLHEVTGRVRDASFVMLRPDRCEIAKELYWGGGRRPKRQDAFALDLVARLAREADVLLDVGAYTGVFTLASTTVNRSLRAHAFEIVPGVADALEQNLARNSVADRVTVHREGVGQPESSMRVPAGEGGSALPSFYSSRMRFDEGVVVGFRSLDSLAALVPARSRVVMKIDVEGTENAVFRHGREFLGRFRPDILCEVLHGVADGEEIEGLLSPLEPRFYLVREADLLPRAHVTPDARFRDWLFTMRDPADLEALGVVVARG